MAGYSVDAVVKRFEPLSRDVIRASAEDESDLAQEPETEDQARPPQAPVAAATSSPSPTANADGEPKPQPHSHAAVTGHATVEGHAALAADAASQGHRTAWAAAGERQRQWVLILLAYGSYRVIESQTSANRPKLHSVPDENRANGG